LLVATFWTACRAFERAKLPEHVVGAAIRAFSGSGATFIICTKRWTHPIAGDVPPSGLAVEAFARFLITSIVVAVQRAEPLAVLAPVPAVAASEAVAFVIASA